MTYYWFDRKEILQKAKERYSKEKVPQYFFKKQKSNKEKVKGSI